MIMVRTETMIAERNATASEHTTKQQTTADEQQPGRGREGEDALEEDTDKRSKTCALSSMLRPSVDVHVVCCCCCCCCYACAVYVLGDFGIAHKDVTYPTPGDRRVSQQVHGRMMCHAAFSMRAR